jgi:uncharacterized surface protein with fasciclin (FAS1) repeats
MVAVRSKQKTKLTTTDGLTGVPLSLFVPEIPAFEEFPADGICALELNSHGKSLRWRS